MAEWPSVHLNRRPGHGGWRQTRRATQELFERRHEVTERQSVEVEQG